MHKQCVPVSKRLLGLFIFSLCLMLLLCGCANQNAQQDDSIVVTTSLKDKPVLVGDIPSAFPLKGKKDSLNIIYSGHDTVDQENVFVWQKYEEMSGIDVHWTNTNTSERSELVSTALMNKQDIDLIMRCRISANRLSQYGETGLILDLAKDDLLKNNAPNCWNYLQTHQEALASVTNPDGTIYALPQINAGAELRVSRKIFINKNWLKNVNMELPTTTEEFYQLLKAFKDQDANGNGDPNDEIPLCSIDWQSVEDVLRGAFGLANRGTHNTLVDADEESGTVRLIAASDAYRDYLEYLNRLYVEGLLDNQIFKITVDQWKNKLNNDQIGVFANTNLALVPAEIADEWVGVDEALEGPNGDKLWTAIRANFHTTGNAVIPATCDDPELVLRWLDYFWTDEGTLFYHLGIEGETFEVKEDGSYDYAPWIYEEMQSENKSFDDTIAKYSPYPGGGNPLVEVAPYFRGGEMAEVPAQAARGLFTYGPKEYWPSFTFTSEETTALNTIKSDIDKFIKASQTEFIMGTRPFSEWDEYLAQLNVLGMDELLDIYQLAADRYEALLP